MGAQFISIRNATKVYETSSGPVRALLENSVAIGAGEFVAIVGPSGCGKTTLLKMIGGLIEATSGEISVAGKEVREPRSDIGIVFQNPVLLPWKTTIQNVLLPIRVHGRAKVEEVERAETLLDLVGLASFRDHYPSQLSGGMQQRAAICRALITEPACLLLDEPFGALDALTRERMNASFNELWRKTGCTVVLVTHSIQEAVFLSNRVLVMSARPGTVIDDLQVGFPAERSPEIIGSPEFGALTNQIRRYFDDATLD
jgi:NitT/TauT family transport system ATP-binding protein